MEGVEATSPRVNNMNLMNLEDKAMMDEFVALYIGMQAGSSIEQKFRESLGVSIHL